MKYIYLDQMHWIALAKAATGRSDGVPFAKIYELLNDLIRHGRAVFPLSFAHLFETARSVRQDQRVVLADLMSRLSGGVVLKWSRPAIEFQIGNAVRELFGKPALIGEYSPFGRGPEEALGVDVCAMLGLPPTRAACLRAILNTPECMRSLLEFTEDGARTGGIQRMDETASKAVDAYRRDRTRWAGANLDLTRKAYAVTLTRTFWQQLQSVLDEVGHTFEEWGHFGPQRLMHFWESIPALHIELELHTHMQRQKSKEWTTHDDRDIEALALAIPSCDIVVTEKFWVDLVRRRKLDQRYDTQVLRNLGELERHLLEATAS